MPNGTLKLYNKLNNNILISLEILGTFNIEENLNETASNMKVKVITNNAYREEFEVNTIAFHEDTNSWWVIKSDESTYLHTGEYEHEIQLVEFLEYYSFRHLPNCAFAPNTYTLDQMLIRLFQIAKLTVGFNYPSFLDKDKVMSFMSFENFTVANAVKNIARAINAIPKFYVDFPFFEIITTVAFSQSPPSSPTLGMYWFKTDTNQLFLNTNGWSLIPNTLYGTSLPIVKEKNIYFVNTSTQQLFLSQDLSPILTFVNRNGLDLPIVETLNIQFPIAYEKNTNSSDQFLTRSVSNITNAKSSSLVVSPLSGGFKMITPNAQEYNPENSVIFLPSKIDKVEFVRVFPKVVVELFSVISGTVTITPLFTGYYTNSNLIKQKAIDNVSVFDLYTLTDLQDMTLPSAEQLSQINYNDALSTATQVSLFKGLFTIKTKFEFDTAKIQAPPFDEIIKVQEKTIHWRPSTNELVMSKNFREGLAVGAVPEQFRFNLVINEKSVAGTGTEQIRVRILTQGSGYFGSKVPTDTTLVQVGYYPIADIKVSVDNDNNAQDEKFFNQSGKVIDAVSVSKLITSHTNDSVEGTKIRNARYESPDDDYTDILQLGQLVRDNNQIYIVTQRSIDGQVKNQNEYYNVIYTLSRNRIARSENIVADSSVISYKTPDDNLVLRSQLYKDYIELSLSNGNHDVPYLNLRKILNLDNNNAGTKFDFTVLAKNSFGSTTIRYVKNPTVFDLYKSKLTNVNWQSNNLLDYRLDTTGSTFVQTPILYTDNLGKANNFELLFLDSNNIEDANKEYNSPTVIDPLVPFGDLTQVPTSFYNNDVIGDSEFSIRITEPNYNKDPFEIPVFEYMIQGNDDYNSLGNVIVGNDLFTTFTGNLAYEFVINDSSRFTSENAIKLFGQRGVANWVLTNYGFYNQTNDPTFPLYAWQSLTPFYYEEIDPALPIYAWEDLTPFYYTTINPSSPIYAWRSVSETFYYQTTDPDAPIFGWTTITLPFYYQATDPDDPIYAWQSVSDTFYYQTTQPSSPSADNYWYNPNNGELRRYIFTEGFFEWDLVSQVVLTGTTLPSINNSNTFFVNTSTQTLSKSFLQDNTTIQAESYWYETDTGVLRQYIFQDGALAWAVVNEPVVVGTTLPTATNVTRYFVNSSTPSLSISGITSDPTPETDSYWYNPNDGVLKQYIFQNGFLGWAVLNGLIVGTTLPTSASADQYFVNTSNQTISETYIQSTPSVPNDSYWYNPSNGILYQYIFAEFVELDVIVVTGTTLPSRPSGANIYFVNTLLQDLHISFLESTPVIGVGSFWFSTINGILYERINTGSAIIWSEIDGIVVTGASLPTTPSNSNIYFVNTTLENLNFSYLLSQAVATENGIWRDPNTNIFRQYLNVGGSLQWVTITDKVTYVSTQPALGEQGDYWINSTNGNIYNIQITPEVTETNRFVVERVSDTRLLFTLYSNYDNSTLNTTLFNNIGFYATDGINTKFLFAINDYVMTSRSAINIYINNWKI
jgi:hypothetical protein